MRILPAIFIILILLVSSTSFVSAAPAPLQNQSAKALIPAVNTSPTQTSPTVHANATAAPAVPAPANASNKTPPAQVNSSRVQAASGDQQFLFLMNQYWIPDLFDIKGRMDSSATFGADLPQMLNLTADYARIRLNKNINETNGYSLSPPVSNLRTEYQNGAVRCTKVIDSIMALNRSSEKFGQDVPTRTAALSLYGTWLEYQTMKCYILPNISYPDIATVPPDQFMQVMGAITS
ncbi:hypothetical protein [uncultured Methanospirillum sp.]|uniref:hypothetical protein n=1 Tax=uncultured Methanospirillum sp. TaxID=262503 RepID=UPI0029C807F8|nr:hypothetical protein [uncultured Methanospirillum sp.]